MPRKKKEPVANDNIKNIEVLIKKKSKKKIKEIPKIEFVTPEYVAPEFKEPEQLYKYSDKIPRHPSRSNVYKKFFTLLQLHSNLDKNKLQAIALNIEKSIFNYTLTSSISHNWDTLFQNKYIGNSVRVYSNLNPDSILKNINLIQRLFNNEIKEFDIVNLSPEKIFPERHKEIVDIIVANTPKEAPKIEIKDMPDGQHKCGYCASQKKDAYKTTHYQLQTRGADESLTTFVQCVQCNKRWRY
jgi:transcription elongation factor S-II